MAVQVNKRDRNSLYFEVQDKLNQQAESYYFDKHFKVGDKYNLEFVKYLLILQDTLNIDNCEISKKLEG